MQENITYTDEKNQLKKKRTKKDKGDKSVNNNIKTVIIIIIIFHMFKMVEVRLTLEIRKIFLKDPLIFCRWKL